MILLALVVLVAALLAYDSRPTGPLHPVQENVTSPSWAAWGKVLSTGPRWKTRGGVQSTLLRMFGNCVFCSTGQFRTDAAPGLGFTVAATHLPAIASGATQNLTVTVVAPMTAATRPLTVVLS